MQQRPSVPDPQYIRVVVHISPAPATENPFVIKVISRIFSGSLTDLPGH